MVELTRFDPAEFLGEPEVQTEFLKSAAERGDAAHMLRALDAVARARNMTDLARQVGITREGLYKALKPGADPRISTVVGLATALGFRLSIEAAPSLPSDPASESERQPAGAEPRPREVAAAARHKSQRRTGAAAAPP